LTPLEQLEQLAADGEEILTCDGFEDALMGVQQTFEKGGINYRALYSLKRCVETLMAEGDMGYDEALEFLHFNTLGAYVGEGTPSFFLDLDLE
jgi:hypothetical protein